MVNIKVEYAAIKEYAMRTVGESGSLTSPPCHAAQRKKDLALAGYSHAALRVIQFAPFCESSKVALFLIQHSLSRRARRAEASRIRPFACARLACRRPRVYATRSSTTPYSVDNTGVMSFVRPMTPMDLLRFNPCNLDHLTETYNIGFYLEYFTKWPSLCKVIESEDGEIEAYSTWCLSTRHRRRPR